MEVNEIQEALLEFLPLVRKAKENTMPSSAVREQMLVFLQRVLGYDFGEDIVLKKLAVLPVRPIEVNFNQKIKFVMVSLASDKPLDEEQVQQAVDYALAAPTNVVMLTNGVRLCFYAVDLWEGKWEVEPLVEVDLLQDNPEEIAPPLWPLAKKDCGREIWVIVPPYGGNDKCQSPNVK